MSAAQVEPVRAGLAARFDSGLVDKLLASHADAHKNFYLGGARLCEVEGGRFCEAAYRMLEQYTTGSFTPLNRQVDTDQLSKRLASYAVGKYHDSLRLHIPRALRVIYDVRNTRNAAHLADGIDPNLQDSTLVVSVMDWVLAEFVRLSHSVSPDEAQRLVESIVTRQAPVIEDFNGFLKVLNPNLKAGDFLLLLLYQRGKSGADFSMLQDWAAPRMRANLAQTLRRLVDDKAFVHYDQSTSTYYVTETGIREVERRRLFEMPG